MRVIYFFYFGIVIGQSLLDFRDNFSLNPLKKHRLRILVVWLPVVYFKWFNFILNGAVG
jgi:hypothetical protein